MTILIKTPFETVLPSFGFFTSAIVARRSTGGGPTIFGSTDFSFLIYFRASIIVGVESETSDVAHGKTRRENRAGVSRVMTRPLDAGADVLA